MKFLKNKLKKIIYHIKNKKEIYDYEIFCDSENEKFKKKALVSYLTDPFLFSDQRIRFSNEGIILSIPRVLNELGYSVDIIDWHDMDYKPKIKYDLFFGHTGRNFRHIYESLKIYNKDIIAICFSPGDYWEFANKQEEKRFTYLKERKGVSLRFDRYHYDYELEEISYRMADGIICLGDNSVLEPYSKFPLVLNINNASYPDNHYDLKPKNFEKIRNNFLFYGGGGNVHKGLDILLDAFAKSDKNKDLYICTFLEPEFKKIYRNELKKSNIHFIGWVEQHSRKFYQIMDNCTFIIFPSCSEGSAGSVVECMNQGLIPIVTKETRIDVSTFGIFLNECTVEEIIKITDQIPNKSLEWIKEKSLLTRKEAITNYSEQCFIKNMKYSINKIIESRNKLKSIIYNRHNT